MNTKLLFLNCILFSILFSSCSIKKNKTSDAVTSVLSIEDMQDSDGDGIPDKLEIERGTNPYVADIPRVKVSYVSDVSLSGTIRSSTDDESIISKEIILPQTFPQTGGSKELDKDYYKALRSKVLANQVAQLKNIEAEKEDLITNEDLRTNILSSWDNDKYFNALDSLLSIEKPINNESGKVSFNFKIKLIDTVGVSDVSNIKLKTFFYNYKKMEETDIYSHSLLKDDGTKETIKIYRDKEANPVSIYKIVSSDLGTDKISDNIKARNEVGLKFTDYDYTSSDIQLNYSTVFQKALDRDSKIIFSNGDKTEIFFVSPLFTLEDALKMLGKKISKDSRGGIFSIDGIETNASLPIDFDTVSKNEFNYGVWSIIGNANSLTDKLVEKGFYVISYAKVSDLLDASKSIQTYPEQSDTISKGIKLEKITRGDELDIVFNSIVSNTFGESITINTVHDKPDPCKFSDPIIRKPGCNNLIQSEPLSCEYKTSTPVEMVESITPTKDFLLKHINITNELGDKIQYSVFSAKNRIHISFDKDLPLQRNNLFISIIQTENKKLRNGIISTTCPFAPNYSVGEYPTTYTFSKDATIYTQNKY